MKPRILIVGHRAKAGYNQPYMDAVRGAGGEPELILPTKETAKDDKALKDFLRKYHGILLPGGVDIEPWRYEEKPHENQGRTDFALDEGQLAVARYVLRENLPTLAICRGLQIMGVAVGSRLYQDLPSQRPSEVNHNILEPKDHLAHEVIVENGSLLARHCGSTQFRVNSRHHQAVRESVETENIGPFRIVARATDGIVEGIELASHRFLVAVQWHPENLVSNHIPSKRLFRGFVDACSASGNG